jgi:hypothetical protein
MRSNAIWKGLVGVPVASHVVVAGQGVAAKVNVCGRRSSRVRVRAVTVEKRPAKLTVSYRRAR